MANGEHTIALWVAFDQFFYDNYLVIILLFSLFFRSLFYKENQSARQKIAKLNDEAFSDLPLVLQSNGNGLNHNYHKYVIRTQDKDTRKILKNALKASIHYETPLSKNSMYNVMNMRRDDCVQSQLASDTVLSLPIHAWLEEQEVNNIIDIVRSIFKDKVKK